MSVKQVNSDAEWLVVVVTKRKVKLALGPAAAKVSCGCFHSRYLCDPLFDCSRAVCLSVKRLPFPSRQHKFCSHITPF